MKSNFISKMFFSWKVFLSKLLSAKLRGVTDLKWSQTRLNFLTNDFKKLFLGVAHPFFQSIFQKSKKKKKQNFHSSFFREWKGSGPPRGRALPPFHSLKMKNESFASFSFFAFLKDALKKFVKKLRRVWLHFKSVTSRNFAKRKKFW